MALTVKLFHIGVLGLYLYVTLFLVNTRATNVISDDPNLRTMGRFTYRFLTNWTYWSQLLYFSICVFAHFLNILPRMQKAKDKVNSFGNILFSTIVGPIALIVTTSFWIIYNIDRELVYPKFLDRVMPIWINHALHTLNSVFPILDMCLVQHKFPSFLFAAKAITAYLLAYSICLFGTYFETGEWIYPFLKELTWPQRGILSVVTLLSALAFFGLLLLFSKLLWGSKKETSTKQPKAKKNTRQKTKKMA